VISAGRLRTMIASDHETADLVDLPMDWAIAEIRNRRKSNVEYFRALNAQHNDEDRALDQMLSWKGL
jgi:hypothetical protein